MSDMRTQSAICVYAVAIFCISAYTILPEHSRLEHSTYKNVIVPCELGLLLIFRVKTAYFGFHKSIFNNCVMNDLDFSIRISVYAKDCISCERSLISW